MRDLTRTRRTLKGLALLAAAALWLGAAPAEAQRAVPRGGAVASRSQASGRRAPSGRSARPAGGATSQGGRAAPTEQGRRAPSANAAEGRRQPNSQRPAVGRAVPRSSAPVPPARRGTRTYVYGYPWGYGGIGFYSGYYGGYGWWDPWWYGGGYPGYYPSYAARYGDGSLRLKVKPRDASVFVDGYYAGIVDDFDGVFQRLHVDSGGHHIEIRLEGYETLSVDLHVQPGRTLTYHGELKRLP